MSTTTPNPDWPAIPFAEWQETYAVVHLYLQIVGKYRLAHTPWVNHAWHATFYPTPRGLTTSMIPDGEGGIEVMMDVVEHRVRGVNGAGTTSSFPLEPMSVAEFLSRFSAMINELGGDPTFHGRPNELPEATPFAEDTVMRPYDADAVARFHRALLTVNHVLQDFRTRFRGKGEPRASLLGEL